MQDPPISRVDLLSARNTLMYFTPEAQVRVLHSFHFALRQTGYLFLGKSEVLMTRTSLFEPVDLKQRVFAKAQRSLARQPLQLPDEAPGRPDRANLRDAGFEAAPVAQLVVARDGTLALANMQARMLFGLTQSDIGRALQDLELSYRPIELRSRIEEVYQERHSVLVRDVEWPQRSGEARYVDVQVVPLGAGRDAVGVSINVSDVTRSNLLHHALDAARRDAEAAYEDLQSTNEELETTNEELQSTNEELETTNEELQSTNEELETMNEELHSTNEELQAINDELERRTDDLHTANGLLESLLTSLAAGVAAVDAELKVTAWNPGFEELWGLRGDEAIGQHFFNLQIGLPVEQLHNALHACLAEGTRQQLAVDAVNRFGRAVRCSVVCSPLLAGDAVRGSVIVVEASEGQ